MVTADFKRQCFEFKELRKIGYARLDHLTYVRPDGRQQCVWCGQVERKRKE